MEIDFQDIPQRYKLMVESIQNMTIKNIYSKFTFRYLSNPIPNEQLTFNGEVKNNDAIKWLLVNQLQNFKFITYHINHYNSYKSNNNKVSAVFCVENQCTIIEQMDLIMIDEIVQYLENHLQSIIINTNIDNSANFEIKEEIQNFCANFQNVINKNEFVRNTIKSIAGYLIRRYYCPSYCFEDRSFFDLGNSNKINEKIIKTEFIDLLNNGSTNKAKYAKIADKINSDNDKISYKNYKENDFITLRLLHTGDRAKFSLVMHLETLYIFVMKRVFESVNSTKEIDFCKYFSHRCLMPFFGFVKDKEKIIGFIYEFMSNGTLQSYVYSKRNSELFSLMTVNRVLQGIEYLYSKSLIHRDLKPSNILLDHDFLPYISDFETIRHPNDNFISNESLGMTYDIGSELYSSPEQIQGETISYPTDIYSFGLIISFLYEEKDMKKLNSNNEAEKKVYKECISDNLKHLIEKCTKINQNERITVEKIKQYLIDDFISIFFHESFLKEYLSKKIHFIYEAFVIQKANTDFYINYFKTIFMLSYLPVLCNPESFQNDSLINESSRDVENDKENCDFPAISNNSESLYNWGLFYEYGLGGDPDYSKAIKYYELAAKQNHSDALVKLGNIYGNDFKDEYDYIKAKEYYELAAKLNNSDALVEIGHLYYFGSGVDVDYIKAKEYYELAAQQNNPESFNHLGNLYEKGLGVEKNYIKAKEYYELAAQQNDYYGFFNLENLYEKGLGVEQDHTKAKEYKELSHQRNVSNFNYIPYLLFLGLKAEQIKVKGKEYEGLLVNLNNSDALLNIGDLYFDGQGVEKNYLTAKKYYELSAKQNNSFALLNIGYLYEEGLGVERDYKKAKKYYKKSTNLRNSEALNYLGCFYLNIEQNITKAIECFELSAKQSNINALQKLGLLYFSGMGIVKPNYVKAKYYFELLAKKDDPYSFNILGYFYYYGIGCEQNFIKAKEYFDLAIEKNFVFTFLNLGDLYYDGYCFKQDYIKAKEYYELAVKDNKSQALFKIGNIYLNENGSERKYVKAIEYFELAAEKNNSDALFILGELYFHGNGVKQDFLVAKYFYELAARQANADAFFKLGIIYSEGKGIQQDYIKAKECYEYSTYNYNPDGYYFLADFYSSGDIFEVNIPKAIQYFMKSLEIHSDKITIYNTADQYYSIKCIYNNYYYHSYNDLGLIYLIVFNDVDNATKYIKESFYGEYPFGQNNFGLLNELFYEKNENANYIFKKSAKNHFTLAEYNLGHLREKAGQIEKSIKYYKRASDDENCPLIFHNQEHHDKRLEISKTFIICLTNLKLTEYYFSKSDFNESKKYFIRSFSKLNINTQNITYQFKVKINKERIDDIFVNLKDFILNFPTFNLINQPNLNINEFKMINKEINKIRMNDSTKHQNHFVSYKIKNKIDDIKQITYNDEIELKDDEIIFDNAGSLFDLIVLNNDIKNIFVSGIKNIIQIMNKIIYTPPYNILFGRIFIEKPKEKEKINPNKKNINDMFYEGFAINLNDTNQDELI